MTEQAIVNGVEHTVTVDAPIAKAFAVFTEGFDSWWPRTHHIGEPEMAEAVLEQRQGGRWYERGIDGSECLWGTVLVWDPPNRVAVSWHLNAEYKYDPDPARASEVAVQFTADGPERTVVTLQHRGFERHGAGAEALRESVDSEGGWRGILRRYAEVAAA
jgi:uncharacterized protein YndB with AHSA1/START domain